MNNHPLKEKNILNEISVRTDDCNVQLENYIFYDYWPIAIQELSLNQKVVQSELLQYFDNSLNLSLAVLQDQMMRNLRPLQIMLRNFGNNKNKNQVKHPFIDENQRKVEKNFPQKQKTSNQQSKSQLHQDQYPKPQDKSNFLSFYQKKKENMFLRLTLKKLVEMAILASVVFGSLYVFVWYTKNKMKSKMKQKIDITKSKYSEYKQKSLEKIKSKFGRFKKKAIQNKQNTKEQESISKREIEKKEQIPPNKPQLGQMLQILEVIQTLKNPQERKKPQKLKKVAEFMKQKFPQKKQT